MITTGTHARAPDVTHAGHAQNVQHVLGPPLVSLPRMESDGQCPQNLEVVITLPFEFGGERERERERENFILHGF